MKSYCEKAARLLIPAVRSLVALRLLENYKLTQTEAAELMGVTQPAVSYYVKARRGDKLADKLEGDQEISLIIDEFVEKLRGGLTEEEMQKILCEICAKAREKAYI